MTARIVILATAILALASPAASAAPMEPPAVAIVTLQRLGSEDWQLDILNSTPVPVTIRYVTWTAPAGLKVGRITWSHGGRCELPSGALHCETHLAAPACRSCEGDRLSVRFKGTGLPPRRWVETSTGGYWAITSFGVGRAVFIASRSGRWATSSAR
jgi:hypothetical protein